MNINILSKMMRNIDPTSVSRFLVRNGYIQEESSQTKIKFYSNSAGITVPLPLQKEAPDYPRRLFDILELFVTDELPIDDVVMSIVLPESDILRYRIETPDTAWGSLRLGYGYEAMQALHSLLKFTAAGVSTANLEYRRVSEDAKAYAQQCRFGQTEYGSYVMKVFCPVRPAGVDYGLLDEPFGRSSTRSVIENLDFLSSEKAEDPQEPLPPTLNRNVAAAVERLKPYIELGSETEFTVRYSSSLNSSPENMPSEKGSTFVNLKLGHFAFSRAKSVKDRLKKSEELQEEVLRGHITTMHKDRPLRDTEQSHEVTLEVKAGAGYRQLRMRLLPAQYRQAIQWHEADEEVVIDAVIDKRSRVWSVYRLKNMKLRNTPQQRMFD